MKTEPEHYIKETDNDIHACHCHEEEGCRENEEECGCRCHKEDDRYPQLYYLEAEPDDFNDWD